MLDNLVYLQGTPPLITDARRARRLPNWLATCLLSSIFIFGASLIGSILAVLLLILEGKNPLTVAAPQSPFDQAAVLMLSFAPLFLILWAWLRLYEKRPFWSLGLRSDRWGARYLRGFFLGMGMFALVMLALWGTGQVQYQPQAISFWQTALAAGVILTGWIVQGPGEEILCRGWMMPVLGARYNLTAGVLVSSAVFSIYHSLNPSLNPVAILNIFLVGIFLCLLALIDNAVWGVFGWHTAWNWAQGNLFGMPVSGTFSGSASFLHFQPLGASLATGGGFGPEGGLWVTAVLIIGILAGVVALRKRSSGIASQNPV